MGEKSLSRKNISAKTQALVKPFLLPLFWVVLSGIFFGLIYRHLVAQAFSQGFVLQELAPVMNAAIDFGRRIYWFAGRPLLIPTVLALLFALAAYVSWVMVSRHSESILESKWLFVVAASYSVMFLVRSTGSVLLKMLGVVSILMLVWYMQRDHSNEREADCRDERTSRIILAGILLMGLVFRLYQLDSFRARYSTDESLLANAALELIGEKTGFFNQYHYMEAYLVQNITHGLAFLTLGTGIFQQRTVSAIDGTLCIFLTYLLCRRLWGNQAGIFAAFMLAVDPWHIGYSRVALPQVEGSLFLVLMFCLLIKALREGKRYWFGMLGACVGVSIYLYQSCYMMIPFAFGFVILTRLYLNRRHGEPFGFGNILTMGAAFLLVSLPQFTFRRAQFLELLSFYETSNNFISAARDTGLSPFAMLCQNLLLGIGNTFQLWWPSKLLPTETIYPNPVVGALSLLGLAILIASRRKLENILILSWIPLPFVPVMVGYGFALRRLFTAFVPLPAMFAGLFLATLWGDHRTGQTPCGKRLSRIFIILLLASITLTSLYMFFLDTIPREHRKRHPKKVAEFINSLPESRTVVITNRIKDFPFILYLINYEKLQQSDDEISYQVADFSEIHSRFSDIASRTNIVVVTDPGTEEMFFLKRLGAANPSAAIIESKEYLAYVMPDGNY